MLPYSHFMTYFGRGELLEAITKKDSDAERDGEDALAARLFRSDKEKILRLLPQYIQSIETMRVDTEQHPDPKPDYLQFSNGAPTWVRLAWKCRMAYQNGGQAIVANSECQKIADTFFEKHATIINLQEEKKLGYTKKIEAIFPDRTFFAYICGKPHAPQPYATPKHLAKNIFREEDPSLFQSNFDRYIGTLLETTLHPEIVQDLLKRLVKVTNDPEHAEKMRKISDNGKIMLERASKK